MKRCQCSDQVIEWVDRVPGYIWMPGYWAGKRGPFARPPVAIVVHSGAKGAGVAEYFATKRILNKAILTHFAWSSTHDCLVQCESIRQTCNHVGPWWNDNSIGIELPGPWNANPRGNDEREQLRALITHLRLMLPSLKVLTTHARLAPKDRRDPGPGVTPDWFDGLGLGVRF